MALQYVVGPKHISILLTVYELAQTLAVPVQKINNIELRELVVRLGAALSSPGDINTYARTGIRQ